MVSKNVGILVSLVVSPLSACMMISEYPDWWVRCCGGQSPPKLKGSMGLSITEHDPSPKLNVGVHGLEHSLERSSDDNNCYHVT